MAERMCPAQCARWAEYLGYCLCTTKDGVSLSLGLASVISWGVAEIPQIITNYKAKSTEGLSFAFLITWIIGDFFNVFGCLLEPATLPTQFYMALLYMVTTLTLTLQSVYYGYIYPRLKSNRQFHKGLTLDQTEVAGQHSQDDDSGGNFINGSCGNQLKSSDFQSASTMSSPMPLPALPRCHSAGQDSYYTIFSLPLGFQGLSVTISRSARSLYTCHTPPKSSFRAPCRGSTSVDDKDSVNEPLLSGSLPTRLAHPSKTKNLFCVVSALTLTFGTLNISSTESTRKNWVLPIAQGRLPGHVNRKLLQVNGLQQITSGAGSYEGIGTYMGWGMAVIYMGGRLPQICLNFRRGHVEGLNPFMFIFALLGNTTYVASILVNSLDWSKIKPNLPWLVDAGGCAILDTFILLQFIYFYYWQSQHLLTKHRESHLK